MFLQEGEYTCSSNDHKSVLLRARRDRATTTQQRAVISSDRGKVVKDLNRKRNSSTRPERDPVSPNA